MLGCRPGRVLITGGAQGLGRELATVFGEHGAELLLADKAEAVLAQTCDELRARGMRCASFPLDVTELPALAELRERVHAEGGPINVLVNSAGVVFGGAFLEQPLERHLATVQVNLQGLIAVTYTFLPDLLGQPTGHVINLASAAGLIGLPYGASYAASKWGVIGFSESLRRELRRLGHRHVGVTTACPSYVGTGMFAGVPPPRMTKLLEPRALAERIFTAAQRNESVLYTPWLVKVTPLLRSVLPTGLMDVLADVLGVSGGMAHWRGREARG